ncbi:hypothetical protein Nepgr_033142 [Nepenthes gracilis]|uniref:Uncharacterized protein n=1 Tax=Nepenthes gracilis TaxID=150966 RepID=A0AAD3TLC9_NEPGR|nr:hypothetical protein Nepgr_033142 [Nepenthes gracilis]
MDKRRHIAIYATASLPWMADTVFNPLFRTAYLAKDAERMVTLVIPLSFPRDHVLVYPDKVTFSLASEHEAYVRHQLEEKT